MDGPSDWSAHPRRRGACAEAIAQNYLVLAGLDVLDGNRRAGGGEIDIIAREGSALVFVEVRMRAAGAWVSAAASIGSSKAARLRACAREILRRRGDLRWPGRTCRFDVVAIRLGRGELTLSHFRGVELPRSPAGRRPGIDRR